MKRLFAIGMIALLLLGAGCSKGKTTKPSGSASATATGGASGYMQVTVGLWGLEPAAQGSVSAQMAEYIGKKFGIDIVPWAMTQSDWKQKIAEAAAAKTLPDVFVQGIFDDRMLFKQLIDEKLIREIPESIWKTYPNVGTVLYRYRKTESVDGRMYFVPRTDMAGQYNNGSSVAIWYRLDWALESGIIKAGQAPSWQEYLELMDYFTHSDPDKNGQDDTRALTCAGVDGLKTAFFMPLGVRDWVLEGGKWIPGLLSSRAKEAVQWANQAYRSGLIDPEYASLSLDDAITRFCSGQTGMVVADASAAGADRINAVLQRTQPDLDIRTAFSVLPEPVNPWGVTYNEDQSYSTGTVFSASVDDKKLKKVLSLMDWLMTDEGLTYANWGVKGKDYNVTGDGLQTLHKDDKNLPVTFGQLNTQWAALPELSSWSHDYIPAARDDDYRLKYLSILKDFWWANDWRKPMFTRYIFDESVQGFDADGKAEAALAQMISTSTDVGADWQAYVTQMTSALNVDAVAKVVNDYAQKNNITKEE